MQLTAQRSLLMEEKQDKYESLSNALALAYASLSGQSDNKLYGELTTKLMGSDRDISYVVISDSQDRVLFMRTRDAKVSGTNAKDLTESLRRLNASGESAFKKVRIPAMVGLREKGSITVGFGAGSVNAAIDEMQTQLLATFAAAFIVGILGSVLLARATVHPINQLIEASHKVAEGDLETSVSISLNDEIGELGKTFNYMVTALKESQDKLIQRANTDSLTDLYNHRYFQERLATEIRRSARYERPLSVIMLDIDHFKSLNDAHGHPFGDEVLCQVAAILRGESRDIDIVARYGGEEFAIVLPETDLDEGLAMAERLRIAVQRHCFTERDGSSVPVTISLGVADYPAQSTEREGLIMAADLAMYESKSMGRNRVTAFSRDMRRATTADPYKLYLMLHAKDMSTVEAIAAVVDAKSERYSGSSREITRHCLLLGQELGLSERELQDLRIASLLRDIGKLGISASVLSKSEPLTEEETEIVRSHPSLGYTIVQKSAHLKSMLPGILHHHEHWDGSGYPNGLTGEEIPLIARIVGVVDAFHAMLTERPHCKASTMDRAKEELQRCAGTQFDPKLTEILLAIVEHEESESQAA
ncbi:MAG: diguanylate cyclase [Armatimonadota bacterium]